MFIMCLFPTERFPSLTTALLVLLILLVVGLIVCGGLLVHFRQYFMSGMSLLLHYPKCQCAIFSLVTGP